jgi:hypothetical protein
MGEGVGQVNLVNDFLLPLKKNGELGMNKKCSLL